MSEEPTITEDVVVPPPRRGRKPTSSKTKTKTGPGFVEVLCLHRTSVTLTGEDGNLYQLGYRERGKCPREEAEKLSCLEIL